jgi:lipopolysaccharide/colanic/teichoic acid biosynthesis glycosyltransferase
MTYRGQMYRRCGKRALDLLLLSATAPVSLPLLVLMAVLVRRRDGAPVLFMQERSGRDGVPFTVVKFRTMQVGADRSPFPDDALITRTGSLLRRTSLDELPQLWNVARGDMSLVGPRPTLPYQVARYDERQRGRLAVRPGLTGLAQVTGRNSLTWAERIELDLEYVRRLSLRTDLMILLRSVGAVLSGSGTSGHPLDDPLAAPDEPR